MIPRYSVAEVDALFSEQAKMSRWLEIELCVAEAMADDGVVPQQSAQFCRQHAPIVDHEFVRRVEEREAITQHDVAAFVDVVQQSIGQEHGSWIHYGLTSTDVVDTGLCWALTQAADQMLNDIDALLSVTVDMATTHQNTPMMGRTHGEHAEPTTFGAKISLFGLQLLRDRARLLAARESIAVCKLSGAVGTYSNISPDVEARVAQKLGLVAVPATQVIARDRHAEFLFVCASIGTTLEQLAVELRHLQRTEVNEVREGFASGQKGSSAMPHKRNPISAETISGLSRVLRANAQVGLQDVALWHERDISHSSAERIVLPDSVSLVVYMLRRMKTLLSRLEVDTENMMRNINLLQGVVFSQSALLAMVASGMSRDDAYRIIQSLSHQALDTNTPLRTLLEQHSDVSLTTDQLQDIFDLSRVLRHTHRSVDVLREQWNTLQS